MHTIYKYTNTVNGKMYIGQTSVSLEERAQSGGSNYRQCRRFWDAICKYGWDSFVPEILCTTEDGNEADELEKYYIELYKSADHKHGYNIGYGGRNSMNSNETRNILSRKAKERYSKKENNPMFGRKHSDDSIKKMSAAKTGDKNPMYGSHWTENQKALCGNKGKKLNISDEQREMLRERFRILGKSHTKRVECIEDGLFFDSATEAAEHYGVCVSTLCGQINGKQHTCKGRHFRYVDDVDVEGSTTIERTA